MNEIVLYGSVGESFWEESYFTDVSVREQLAGMRGPLTVRINSGGGLASQGTAIYTLLKDYPGTVDVVVDGVAYSAASLIAMAGDTITMRDGSTMLIHDPATYCTAGRGTEDDHMREARRLGVIANTFARIYARRAGISQDEARRIMRDETVMDGPMALQMGFATATDSVAAEAAAPFDYRVYTHAPEDLRAAAESFGEPKAREAVLAMFAGEPRNHERKATMAEDIPVAEEKPVATPTEAPATQPKTEMTADPTRPDPAKAERARASRITALVAHHGLDLSVATEMIDAGTSLEAAVDRLTQMRADKDGDTLPRMGAPTARIIRDERETRMNGMAAALEAQLSRSAPADVGRAFMDMGIVEMATVINGNRRVPRSPYEREQEVSMAMHTTSDLPAILENALNKRLLGAYQAATPVYRSIAERMDFTDFRPHPISTIGNFANLDPINEGGEITFGTVGEKKETVSLLKYGKAMSISRDMIVNDDLDAINRVLTSRGTMVALWEDLTFFAMFISGANSDGPTLLETGRQVFNTTDGTKAGSNAAISVTSINAGRAAMRKRKGIPSKPGGTDGPLLNVVPTILLVGPDKELEAQQLLAPIQAQQSGNVNPFSGSMRLVVSPHIAGNAWYLLADPAAMPGFMYGFLRGEPGPRMRMEEKFGRQGISYSVERDFGTGAIEWRGVYKNAGA